MSFIYNDVLERNIEENGLKILNENLIYVNKYFIAGDKNVELIDIFILLNIAFKPYIIMEPLITPELVPALNRVDIIVEKCI